ncbi:hypothetical protein PROPEN_01581 [Proteus penneri ATCC 35198]|nr:hypothetical protein PROPEN_01581 [Proteus penneri ATCC 35198]
MLIALSKVAKASSLTSKVLISLASASTNAVFEAPAFSANLPAPSFSKSALLTTNFSSASLVMITLSTSAVPSLFYARADLTVLPVPSPKQSQ